MMNRNRISRPRKRVCKSVQPLTNAEITNTAKNAAQIARNTRSSFVRFSCFRKSCGKDSSVNTKNDPLSQWRTLMPATGSMKSMA